MSQEGSSPTPPVRIVDLDNKPPVYVDWFIGVGQAEGIINISLGTYDPTLITEEGYETARAFTACKIRMTVPFAKRFRDLLHTIVEDAESTSTPESSASED